MTDDSTPDAFDALLIIGHGTRDPAGLAEFRFFVDQVAAQQTDWHVAGCFLELAEPSIAMAVDQPRRERTIRAFGQCRWCFFPPAMPSATFPTPWPRRSPGIPASKSSSAPLSAATRQSSNCRSERCRQAIVGHAAVSPDETLLILVGRGSSDAEAIAQMRRLADLRRGGEPPGGIARQSNRALESSSLADGASGHRATPEDAGLRFAHVEVGFVAVATPSLSVVLEQAARTDFRRVIVQPHLLFAGSVLAEIRQRVEHQQSVEPGGKTSEPGVDRDRCIRTGSAVGNGCSGHCIGRHPPAAWRLNQN